MAYLVVNDVNDVLEELPVNTRIVLQKFLKEGVTHDILDDVPNNLDVEEIAKPWLKIVYRMEDKLALEDSNGVYLDILFDEFNSSYFSLEEIDKSIEMTFKKFPKIIQVLKVNIKSLNEEFIVKTVFDSLDLAQSDYAVIFEDSNCSEFLFARLKH